MGTNTIKFNGARLNIDATRMSGEMNTSLGNGFTNLVLIKLICSEKGYDVHPVIEGDDALFKCPAVITQEDFAQYGVKCKIETHSSIYTAGFCGIVFDNESKSNICNPTKVMLKLPWSSRKYLTAKDKATKSLLKSKALSILWQYPGCPIVNSFALSVLRQTFHVTGKYERQDYDQNTQQYLQKTSVITSYDELIKTTPMREITMSTRILMEQKFDYTIQEQLELEKFFDNKMDLQPWYHNILDDKTNEDQRHYFNYYVDQLPLVNLHRNPFYTHIKNTFNDQNLFNNYISFLFANNVISLKMLNRIRIQFKLDPTAPGQGVGFY